MIPRLSKLRGSPASKGERRPLTDLLSPDLRRVFLRDVEPLLSFTRPQHDLWTAEDSLHFYSQELVEAQDLLQRARENDRGKSYIAWVERRLEKARKKRDVFKELVPVCKAILERQRLRVPPHALRLLDPLPAPAVPVPAPQPSHPAGPWQDFDLHQVIRRQRRRYWGCPEDSGDDQDDEAEPSVYRFLGNVDVLGHALAYLAGGRGANALATTCHLGRQAVWLALEDGTVSYRHFARTPFDQLPRLRHLQILRSNNPPTLPWFLGVITPVAPRLLSLRLGISRSALIDAFLQLEWPLLEELRLDIPRTLGIMAAHPRTQGGGGALFPRLLELWFKQEQSTLECFAIMAEHGCFPALRCLNSCYYPFAKKSINLVAAFGLNPRIPTILAHAPDTEIMTAYCETPWHSEAFFTHALSDALATHLTHLRTLSLRLPLNGFEPSEFAAPLLVLLRALTANAGAAASVQSLTLDLGYSDRYSPEWDWDGPALPAGSFSGLRQLKLACTLSRRALISILGAAGTELQELSFIGEARGLDFLRLVGTNGDGAAAAAAPPPFLWVGNLKRLTMHGPAIPKEAMRNVDSAMGRLRSLERLNVAFQLADALLVAIIRHRERGGLAGLSHVNFSYGCSSGGGLLLLAFVKTQREGAARGLRSSTACRATNG